MKFENWRNETEQERKKKKESFEEKIHEELTDPVVRDLLEARKRWQEEFEKREEESKKRLKEARKKGKLFLK